MSKIITGKVVHSSAKKTISVELTRLSTHPIYKKKFKVTRRISAHDENDLARVGDLVEIAETTPISKTKSWTLVRVISSEQKLSEE